jgi:hypothetical protein
MHHNANHHNRTRLVTNRTPRNHAGSGTDRTVGVWGVAPHNKQGDREGAQAPNRASVGAVEALSKTTYQTKRLLEIAEAWNNEPQANVWPSPTDCRTARPLRPDEIDKLAAAYQAGATVFQLATQFGLHRTTVGRHLKARGIDTRSAAITDDELKDIIELYRTGWAITPIAKHYRVSSTAIRDRLLAAGVKLRPRGWPKRVRSNQGLHDSRR